MMWMRSVELPKCYVCGVRIEGDATFACGRHMKSPKLRNNVFTVRI